MKNLENQMELSKMQLYRKLKALTGMSPTLVIRDIRLNEAMKLLQKGELNVSEVAYEVGFSDPSYFTRTFKEKFGSSPSKVK
ncbi:MAG: helix-turn-helix transcriptional regulator [Flavobacteriales bacterium]